MKSCSAALAVIYLIAATPWLSAQQTVSGDRYVVASGHPAATAIGLDVLRRGGNVVDAAVATSLALGVAEPYGSGLGGKLVMLYRDGGSGKVYSIVALCTSPESLNAEEFAKLSGDQRKYGFPSAGVPGLPAGIFAAHERWGSLPWRDLVEPAAELADRGIEIDETVFGMFAPKVPTLRRNPEAARLYLINDEAPPVGARLANPDLAVTLRAFAAGGRKAFYEGDTAEKIVTAAQEVGSSLSLADFRDYRPKFSEPLSIDYRGYRIYSCPPPLTGGVTVLAALKSLEKLNAQPIQGDTLEFVDASGRVLQCLYPKIRDMVADVINVRTVSNRILSGRCARCYAEEARRIDPRKPYGSPDLATTAVREWSLDALAEASTTHLVVADAKGNVVCLTQSLSLHFGAAAIAPGTGVLLNDSLSNFSVHDPESVNHVSGGKRARSTIAPIIVTKAGKPRIALGIPGGQRIPTTTLQLLWRLLDNGESLAEAFEASRFHLRRPLGAKQAPNIVDVEDSTSNDWDAELDNKGWKVVRRTRDGHYFGGGNGVRYNKDNSLTGVADSRRTNYAAAE